MSRFRPIDRKTAYLLPPSADDWLPQDPRTLHCRSIEQLDLSTLTRAYAGRGSAAYHPEVLLGLLVYGYATATFSSRRIERATYDSFAADYLAADSLTDQDSRIMSQGVPSLRGIKVAGGGVAQCYNAQAAVDAASMLVVVPAMTQAANDKQQIEPVLERIKALPTSLGRVETLLADAGYCSANNLAACEAAGVDPHIAVAKEDHHPDWRARFAEPEPLTADATPMQKMAHKLKTKLGRMLYALRKQTVEPVFGIIKSVMGFRQFMLRGLAKVTGEWTLACLAWNLKRMAALRQKSVSCL